MTARMNASYALNPILRRRDLRNEFFSHMYGYLHGRNVDPLHLMEHDNGLVRFELLNKINIGDGNVAKEAWDVIVHDFINHWTHEKHPFTPPTFFLRCAFLASHLTGIARQRAERFYSSVCRYGVVDDCKVDETYSLVLLNGPLPRDPAHEVNVKSSMRQNARPPHLLLDALEEKLKHLAQRLPLLRDRRMSDVVHHTCRILYAFVKDNVSVEEKVELFSNLSLAVVSSNSLRYDRHDATNYAILTIVDLVRIAAEKWWGNLDELSNEVYRKKATRVCRPSTSNDFDLDDHRMPFSAEFDDPSDALVNGMRFDRTPVKHRLFSDRDHDDVKKEEPNDALLVSPEEVKKEPVEEQNEQNEFIDNDIMLGTSDMVKTEEEEEEDDVNFMYEDDGVEDFMDDDNSPSSSTDACRAENSGAVVFEGHNTDIPKDCKICGERFSAGVHLSAHIAQKHKFTFTCHFPCDVCGKTFRVLTALTMHKLRTHQRGYFPPSCKDCHGGTMKTFHTRKEYASHMLKVHKKTLSDVNGASKCPLCDEFFSKTRMRTHIMQHHAGDAHRDFKCEYCMDTVFQFPDELSRHYQITHRLGGGAPLRQKDSKFMCKQCPCVFSKLTELSCHAAAEHGLPTFTCYCCEEFDHTALKLTEHRKKHIVKRNGEFLCNVCEFSYAKMASATMHLANKHKPRIVPPTLAAVPQTPPPPTPPPRHAIRSAPQMLPVRAFVRPPVALDFPSHSGRPNRVPQSSVNLKTLNLDISHLS